MTRINLKALLLICMIAAVFLSSLLWAKCGQDNSSISLTQRLRQANDIEPEDNGVGAAAGYEEIECRINSEYQISCRKEGDEIYVPFSFLHKYFEVYGKISRFDGIESFDWSHSYSKIYTPKEKYDPRGIFMYFDNYNVEVRERVKCVSASEGVPISTQWQSSGYFYPTQVAQFGLSHYSKNLTDPEPRRKILEDGNTVKALWNVPNGASITRVSDQYPGSRVLKFNSNEHIKLPGVSLRLDVAGDFVLSAMLKLKGNASIIVNMQNKEEIFSLGYQCGDERSIWADNSEIWHGLGRCSGLIWLPFTRDLVVDLQKGWAASERPRRKLSRSRLRILSLTLRGSGSIDNLTISSADHMAHFYAAARWFVKHQTTDGGWPIPVKRKLSIGMKELPPGWLSAMGQGHAISVLARAFHHSNDPVYLEAAQRALKPFNIASDDGGVRAEFLGGHVWYEEYPTSPPSFVLNGFIYALLGLYDLKIIGDSTEAARLYEDGLNSLKTMLLMYDTGSGTIYDLRHLSLGCAPNIARWDYHATHVNQLLTLATIENEQLFSITAERWSGYMIGKRAAHN